MYVTTMAESSDEDQQHVGGGIYSQTRKALRSIGNKHNKQLAFTRRRQASMEEESLMLIKASKEGNFAKIISVIASQTDDAHRQKLVNEAQRRCEATPNLKKCTFRNDREWYDLTPLALAALKGRANIVEYLLRQGADPILRGSPVDGEDYNSVEAAKKGAESVNKVIESVLSNGKEEILKLLSSGFDENFTLDYQHLMGILQDEAKSTQSALKVAQVLAQKRVQCPLCVSMLEAAEPFWPRAQNYSAHYRKRSNTNEPKDMKALRAALDAVSMEGDTSLSATKAADQEALANRLAAKMSLSNELDKDAQSKIENSELTEGIFGGNSKTKAALYLKDDDEKPRKKRDSKMRRGRRHSYSMCVHPMSVVS
jgi:ankyrin repeat protein